MAIINCRECGREYSNNAIQCPYCGNPTIYTNNNVNTQSNNSGCAQVLYTILVLIVCVGGGVFMYNQFMKPFESKIDGSSYNTYKTYSVGDTLTCPNWEITIEEVKVKKKGERIDKYSVVSDPELIGVILSVKNIGTETDTYFTTNVNLTNSHGEVIDPSYLSLKIWGTDLFDSPELTPGGYKKGYIQYSNTDQDDSNLILNVDCDTDLFDDDVIYKVDISQ